MLSAGELAREPQSDQLRECNNWDVIRLILALIVVAYHSHVMSGQPVPRWYSAVARGDLAVAGFFGLSGYMVAGSYARSRDLKTYFLSRFCRIYPAYFASVIFALGAGLWVTTERDIATLAIASTRYLLGNLSFIVTVQSTIPGAFENHLNPQINTAWWTLKIEVGFYFVLPVLILLLKDRRGIWYAAGLYALGYIWSTTWNALSDPPYNDLYARMARQLPGWTGYFVVGASAYLHRDLLLRYRKWAAAGAVCAILPGLNTFDLLAPLAITCLALSAGLIGPHVPINRLGDISFGIYVYHSPIIQLLIWSGIAQRIGTMGTLATTMIALIPLAWLSWTFIERPAMRWAKRRPLPSSSTRHQDGRDDSDSFRS